MHLVIEPSAALTLTHDELRIVGLALAGKLKDPDDRAAAAKLNIQILEARAKLHKEFAELARISLERYRAENPPPPTTGRGE